MDVEGVRLQRRATRVWWLVGVAVLLWIVWRVAGPILGVVVPPIILAIIIVYLLNPLVNALEGPGRPRIVGTAIAYLLVAAVVTIPAVVVMPLLAEQATSIWEQAPETLNAAVADIDERLARRGWDLGLQEQLAPEDFPAFDFLVNDEEGRSAVVAVVGGIGGFATGVIRLFVTGILGPVVAFYVLVDLPRLRRWAVRLIPPTYRAEAAIVGRELSGVIGGYLRGQLLVALYVGSAVSLGMWLIDLPYWLVVGIVAGLTNLVPLLGPFVAGVLGASIALANGGIGFALLVVVVLTIVQQTDNHLISPLVMGQSVHVHPLIVLLALLVGGTLYGLFGLLIAVPVVAAIRVITRHMWETRVPWAGADPPDPAERHTASLGPEIERRSQKSAADAS